MKLKETAFKKSHFDEMDIQDQQMWVRKYRNFSEELERQSGLSRTLTLDGKPLLVVAALPTSSYSAEVFTIMSTDFGKHALISFRKVRSLLDRLHRMGFEKLTTVVNVNFHEAQRWCRMLGFEEGEEVELPSWAEKRKVILYERIEQWEFSGQ